MTEDGNSEPKKKEFKELMAQLESKIDPRNLFDKGMDLAKLMLDKGYTRAWFTWLEWVTITAFFLALAIRVGSIFLIVVSLASGGLLFFTGLAAALKASTELSHVLPERVSKGWVILLAIVFIFSVPAVVFKILMTAFEGVIRGFGP